MLPDLLHRISRASVVQMDRWLMVIKPPEDEQSQRSDRRLCFSNYFGVGIDAVICREFHEARQRRPHHFFSQIGNKIWYFLFGGKELLLPQFSGLADAIDLLALQRKVPLPDDTEGLIFTNIPHYGGGVRLWAPTSSSNELESPSQTTMPVTPRASTRRRARSANVDLDSPQSVSAVALAANVIVHTDRVPWRNESLNDGLLECVQISGPLHLGQIQIGLDRATPLAQSAGYDLVLFGSAAVQADGEPLGTFGSGTRVHVQRHSESALMLTIDDSGVATAEAADMARDLIDWAARRDLISSLQSAALLHELHARLV
jgi:diacylglycerol kinase (ATP)